MTQAIILFVVQAIVTIVLFLIVMNNLHIDGPVGNLIIIPIFLCLTVGVVSVIGYSIYASSCADASWGFGKALLAFIMPFVEFFAFYFISCFVMDTVYKIRNNIEFYYDISISAPEIAPVQINTLCLRSGRTKYEPSFQNMTHPILEYGLGQFLPEGDEGEIHSIHEYRHIPKNLTATWISFVDRKVYSVDAELPYDTLKSYLKDEEKDWEFINFCFLPEGEVKISMGSRKYGNKLLNWSAKGTECKDERILEDLLSKSLDCSNMEQYFEQAYSGKIMKDNQWITYPKGKIEKCLERFNYDIVFEFKGEDYTITEYDIIYSNGERSFDHDCTNTTLAELSCDIDNPSRIAEISSLKWETTQYEYELEMQFNEDDIINMFDKNYGGDRMQKGEFRISLWIDTPTDYLHYRYQLNVGGKENVYKGVADITDFTLTRKKIDDSKSKDNWSSGVRRNYFGL